MSETETEATEQPTGVTPEAILQLGLGFWGSKTLLSAVELGAVHRAGQTGRSTARRCASGWACIRAAPRDFFDALVALGMLEREDGRYPNTPATELFLDRAKPSYIGGLLEMANARLYGFWGSLTEGLRTGQPQNEAKEGENFFDALYPDPARLAQFARGDDGGQLGRHTRSRPSSRGPIPDRGRHRLRRGRRARCSSRSPTSI